MSAAYPESPTEPDGYDPAATCADGGCVAVATHNVEGRLVCGDHADELDPDVCEDCGQHPPTGGGSYPTLCSDCGFIAHKEDKADDERDW